MGRFPKKGELTKLTVHHSSVNKKEYHKSNSFFSYNPSMFFFYDAMMLCWA